MKILKNGTKKFEPFYHVFWNKYECPSCNAVFEAQTGEVDGDTLICPYCGKNHLHGEYKVWLNYRDAWLDYRFVEGYDPMVNEKKVLVFHMDEDRKEYVQD